MRVLIDTNVVLDVLLKREGHRERSEAFLRLTPSRITGLLTATQTKDLFYLLRRAWSSSEDARNTVADLIVNFTLVDVLEIDVQTTLSLRMSDYEDALIAACAKRVRADYIITRNTPDFRNSPIPAITPSDFLDEFFP